jgi:carboxypeptidase C (cathepsin A)
MRKTSIALALTTCFALAAPLSPTTSRPEGNQDRDEDRDAKSEKLAPKHVETEGSVTVEGKKIDYKAVAGTIILDDKKARARPASSTRRTFKKLAEPTQRPIMFIYNGGPVRPRYGCTWVRSAPSAS